MSFSQLIKSELAQLKTNARCCNIAELSAMINLNATLERHKLSFKTESLDVAKKYFTLLKKTFNIEVEITLRKSIHRKTSHLYLIHVIRPNDIQTVLSATRLYGNDGIKRHISSLVTGKVCCKRAYLRGLVLSAGSITSPQKGYHLELTLKNQKQPEPFQEFMRYFDIDAKTMKRGQILSLYMKDSAEIAQCLNICGATNGYMEYENTKIYKEVRNGVNRLCNCDAANINKTVTASQRQLQAIDAIDKAIGIDALPDNLKEIARVRRQNPDLNLEELGKLLNPHLGKSGVNHRFRKLDDIAKELL